MAVVALAIFLGWLWRGDKTPTIAGDQLRGGPAGKFGGSPVSVAVATVETGDLDIYVDAIGTVVPLQQVVVRSRVDGELSKVHFREGQSVKAGDLLAEIDPRPFLIQLGQARGQLARDEALLQNARIDLARYESLWREDSISRQELDTQQALVRQYEGAVESDRSDVDSASLQLEYARITAPISGRVGLRQVDPGNIVKTSDSTGLLQIVQTDPIAVVFSVPETVIDRIASRAADTPPLLVEAWDREQKRLLARGRLLTYDNQIDSTTGTLKLKAVFDNGADNDSVNTPGNKSRLFPNQFVNVRLLTNTLRNATLVPADAIQRGSKGLFVYAVQDDQTVRQAWIESGESAGERVAINSGISAGARLVVDGSDKLRDGAKVLVLGGKGEGKPDQGGGKTVGKHDTDESLARARAKTP